MLIELNVVVDLYDTPNPETGISKLIKKNIVYKKAFNTEGSTVEQYISSKGEILKGYSNVIYNGQTYKVKHPYDYVYNQLKPIEVKGLIRYGKKGNKN